MSPFFLILSAICLAVAAFLSWRFTAFARGARQRDAKLFKMLEPLAQKLKNGEIVSAVEVRQLCEKPQLRSFLHDLLYVFYEESPDLFPQEFLSHQEQGVAILSHWMMHPNELQDAPAEIELLETVEREVGKPCRFFVYRYRMPPGHWAEQDGWLMGLAGPFFADDPPFPGTASGFSRVGDSPDKVAPAELVDWYLQALGLTATA
jgi:hypothetical protein